MPKQDKLYSEEYVKINDTEQYFLHYAAPTETVAIVLHGGPGQSEAHFAYYLSGNWGFCNMVYYDQRGTGKTQSKNRTKAENITIDKLISDLKQTIKYIKRKYNTEKIILLGHSWGSILGTQYILKYPTDVACYVGFGQIADMLRGEKTAFDKLAKLVAKSGNARDVAKLDILNGYPYKTDLMKTSLKVRKLQGKYGLTVNYREMFKKVLKSPIFQLRDFLPFVNSLKTNRNLTNLLFTYSVWDTTSYNLPIYYILGRDDWQVPSVLAAEYFDKITAPKKAMFWIENAGHLTDIDNPKAFNSALAAIVENL
jgi:pimeloyl-ACP methyl ester carboxylesterase